MTNNEDVQRGFYNDETNSELRNVNRERSAGDIDLMTNDQRAP